MITLVIKNGVKIILITVGEEKNILNENSMTFEERKAELEKKEKEDLEKKEKAKRNKNFVMFYREHMPEMRWLIQKSGIAANILNFIIEHMDYKNALICSHEVLMDYFEVSKPTITRAIKLLKENGFVDVLKSGTSNIYIVNHEVAWCSWENQKEYCKFDGNILISKTENKDYFYRNQFEKFKELRSREKLKS